jgi:hypothetical protein
MLTFAVEFRAAIDLLSGDKANGLRAYELSKDEWKIATQLSEVLNVSWRSSIIINIFSRNMSQLCHLTWCFKIFKDATLFFSRSTPNLATVIPAMDHIDKVLSTQSLVRRFEPAIRAALSLTKKTLNQYYNLTDNSEVYRIAMGMFSLLMPH